MRRNETDEFQGYDPSGSGWLTFLAFFCPGDLYEEIAGDIIQRFYRDAGRYSVRKAKRQLALNVLRFLRPGILARKTFSGGFNEGIMIGSYLQVMFRSILKKKLYSAINIFGLTTGITFALVVGVFIRDEFSVNASLKNVDRLYFLESKYKKNGGNPWFVPAPLVQAVRDQRPEMVVGYYRFLDRNVTVSSGDKHLRLQSMIGDSTLLHLFGFKVLYGDARTALNRPNVIVVTESVANRFFGKTDIAGQFLTIAAEGQGKRNFEVTAVIADPQKKNSVTDFLNMNAEVFLPLQNRSDFSMGSLDLNDWQAETLTYLELGEDTSPLDLEKALNVALKKNLPGSSVSGRTVEIKPLSDYYRMTNEGLVQNLIVSLSLIVVFILLLAVANFINITIGGSFSRMKEIGIRKAIGGVKRQIIVQFVSESVIFSCLSGVFALVTYEISRSYFGYLLEANLSSIVEFSGTFWLIILCSFIVIGIMAGAYPSFYLSSTLTIESLKGKFRSVSGAIQFSRGLIATQFIISIFIFIGALVMSLQISYSLNKDLGFEKSAVLVVTSAPRLWTQEGFEKMDNAKHEFHRMPVVTAMSLSTGSPTGAISMDGDVAYLAGHLRTDGIGVTLTGTDEEYAKVYGLKMSSGRYFNNGGEPFLPNSVVINETLESMLQVKVGDKLKLANAGDVEYSIIGIVRDFNFESLHSKVQPLVILHSKEYRSFRYYSFKLTSGNLVEKVRQIEEQWRKTFPDDAFVYGFADEKIRSLYKTELQLKKAASLATALMLVIVLTGVLGLVSLTVAKRNKEIGIRKVLGASARQILVLLSREYAALMVIAFGISLPLSYWFVIRWLTGFQYHLELQSFMFILPALFLFVMTILMVSIQGLSAALANPVKSLKYE